jgi:transposase-like protein
MEKKMKKTEKILEIEKRIGEPIENYLKREYSGNRRSTVQIGKKLGVSNVGISRWMRKYNLPIRSLSESHLLKGFTKPTKEELNKLYNEERKSTIQIGRKLGITDNTIRRWMRKYNLPIRRTLKNELPKGFTKPTKEELNRLYHDERKSLKEIGKELGGVSTTFVSNLMERYRIDRRDSSESRLPKDFIKPTKEELNRLYHNEGKSTVEIGKKLGITDSTISRWMRKYNLPIRSASKSRLPGFVKPTKEELNRLYYDEGKSTDKIGKNLGVSSSTIISWMKKYDIPIRNANITSKQFINLLKKDKTARNLAFGALSLGYDLEKTLVEVYEGRFKDVDQISKLLFENKDEIYNLVQNGITNLGTYLGDYSLGDRKIMPIILCEALESIPEDKVTIPIKERFTRMLQTVYSPKFNSNPKKIMNDLEKKVDNSKGKVKELYQGLYTYYEEVLELEKELNG